MCTDHEAPDCRHTAVVATYWCQGLHTAECLYQTYEHGVVVIVVVIVAHGSKSSSSSKRKKKKKKKIPHRPRSVAWELIPFTAL